MTVRARFVLFSAVLLGCDSAPQRESTTVRRDYPTARDAADAELDAADSASPDAEATSVTDSAGPDADTAILDPETAGPDSDTAILDSETAGPDTDTAILDSETAGLDSDTAISVTDSATPEAEVAIPDAGPETGPVEGEPCQVGSLVGSCQHIADCGPDEIAAEGFCAGDAQTRCCLDDTLAVERCSANRAPGACMATASCSPGTDWKTTSGLCPGAADIRCCTSTTAPPLCDPSVKPTPNDGLVEEPGDPGCPAGMVYVSGASDFCMDRFEASLVLANDPSTSLSPYHNPGATAVRAVSVRYGVPQGYIDEVRAKAACGNAGKRLCTTNEWLFACKGDSNWTYPYGPAREPGRCNDDRKQHVAVEYFGTSESWIFSEIDNACLAQLPASLDLAGENEGCQTPTGIYDLMGNLHEWVDDAAGTFRGGFFDDTTINGNGCDYRTTAHDVSHWDYSTGFRCCADPTP